MKKSQDHRFPSHSLPRVKMVSTPDNEPQGIENFINQQSAEKFRASYLKKEGVTASLSNLLGLQKDSSTSLPRLPIKHISYKRNSIVRKSRQSKLFIPGISKSQQFLQGHSQSVIDPRGIVEEDTVEMESNESSLQSQFMRMQPRHERYVLVLYQGLKIAKPITRLMRFVPNPPMVDNAQKSKNLNNFLNKVNKHFKDLAGPVRHLFLQDGQPILSLDQIKPEMKFIYAGSSPHFYGIQQTLLSGRLRKEINGVLSQELALVEKLRNHGLKNKFLKSFNFKSSFSKGNESEKQIKVWDALEQFEYDQNKPLAAEADKLLSDSIQCLPDEQERARLLEMYKPALLKKRAAFYSSNKGKIINMKKTLMNKQTLDFNDSELFSREDSLKKFNIIVEESESRKVSDSHRYSKNSSNEGRLNPIKIEYDLEGEKKQESMGEQSVDEDESSTHNSPSHKRSVVLPLIDQRSQASGGKKSLKDLSQGISLLPL